MLIIDHEIAVKIDLLLKSSDDALRGRDKNFEKSLELCNEAFSLIPEPKMDYLISLTVLGHLMDTYFRWRDYANAMRIIIQIEENEEFSQNEFILLRKGQILVETVNILEAQVILKNLLNKVGESIFEGIDTIYLYVAKFGKLPTRRYYPHRAKKSDENWLPPENIVKEE